MVAWWFEGGGSKRKTSRGTFKIQIKKACFPALEATRVPFSLLASPLRSCCLASNEIFAGSSDCECGTAICDSTELMMLKLGARLSLAILSAVASGFSIQSSTTRPSCRVLPQTPSRLMTQADDDDGWGMDELEALRAERESKATPASVNNNNNSQEPDLFIPIVSIVALAGLFGAYGYEMLRLYSRGELYLPGM